MYGWGTQEENSLELGLYRSFLFSVAIPTYYDTQDPTDPFTILEPRDQEIAVLYAAQERGATDFEAPKLWKGLSGKKQQEKLKKKGAKYL